MFLFAPPLRKHVTEPNWNTYNTMKIKHILFVLAFFAITGWSWGPLSFIFAPSATIPRGTEEWVNKQIYIINSQANNIDPKVLKMSLAAYVRARQHGLDNKQLLTIIDYSKPSTQRRLWVVDLKKERVLFNTWVTHGKNSGDIQATSFSNEPGSLKSSLGVFLTIGEPYVGSNGYSLRLLGLERGINDNAYRRDIVVHGAWYANHNVVQRYRQLGRSWGCPAVSEDTVRPLINTIRDKTLVFVYYPDRHWINNSAFLTG